MASLGALTFAAPAVLVALLALPALWWLLRIVPPAPLQLRFPPFRLLAQLASREESVQRTPPWLLALRIALAAAVILGLAHPLLNAAASIAGTGPVILIVDDGWAAARNWPARQDLMVNIVERADREGRSVLLVTTAPDPGDEKPPPLRLMSAAEARERVRGLAPNPWRTRRAAALDALLASPVLRGKPPGAIVWLSDGIEEDQPRSSGPDITVARMAQSLLRFGGVTLMVPEEPERAIVLRPPLIEGSTFVIEASRAPGLEATRWVRALSEDGAVLAREPLEFAPGAARASMAATLPLELINRIVRVELDNETTAGSVVLLDERWRRRPVGIVTDPGPAADLPLLSETYYLERALEPVAEVRRGSVATLLGREISVLFLVDSVMADENVLRAMGAWVQEGGVLVRFAGPHLAARAEADDALLPTPLRAGDRVLGGSMTWREPARLAPFDTESPFTEIAIPPDVDVRRQVLAEPSLDQDHSTWARLDDGTPLVTAARRGDGWVVLFHVTASADWS
ncbi:MAG: BatA domain-containing protein, partial [Caulobacteraceae bacterium]